MTGAPAGFDAPAPIMITVSAIKYPVSSYDRDPALKNQMSNCWAECLGDCSDKMSREHIFSKGIFFSDELTVQGLAWCSDTPVSVGLASLTAKILCSKHNNDLSVADSAAASATRAFEEALALHKFREQFRPTYWSRRDFNINGYELESWFLKTLINVSFRSEKLIGKDATEPGIPSRQLVEIAFQRRRFEAPAGLYTIPAVGETSLLDGRLRVTLMAQKPGATLGAIFTFAGLRYFLYLDDKFTPGPENFKFHSDPIVGRTPFLYRFRQVKFPVHGKLSHTITMRW
jgi:hypothetical protein